MLSLPPDLEAAYRSAPKCRETRKALRLAIRGRRRREEAKLRDDLVFGALPIVAKLASRHGGESPDAMLEAISLAVKSSRLYDPNKCEFTTYVSAVIRREFAGASLIRRGHAKPWEPLVTLSDDAESSLATGDGCGLEDDEIDELAAKLRDLPPLYRRLIRGLAEGKPVTQIASEANVGASRARRCLAKLRAIARDPVELNRCLDGFGVRVSKAGSSAKSSGAMPPCCSSRSPKGRTAKRSSR